MKKDKQYDRFNIIDIPFNIIDRILISDDEQEMIIIFSTGQVLRHGIIKDL